MCNLNPFSPHTESGLSLFLYPFSVGQASRVQSFPSFSIFFEGIAPSENELPLNHFVLLLWGAESACIDARTMFVSVVNVLTRAQCLLYLQVSCSVHGPSS